MDGGDRKEVNQAREDLDLKKRMQHCAEIAYLKTRHFGSVIETDLQRKGVDTRTRAAPKAKGKAKAKAAPALPKKKILRTASLTLAETKMLLPQCAGCFIQPYDHLF